MMKKVDLTITPDDLSPLLSTLTGLELKNVCEYEYVDDNIRVFTLPEECIPFIYKASNGYIIGLDESVKI